MADMHMMLVDGKVQMVDLEPMIRRHRDAHVKARAAMIGEPADLFGCESMDPGTVWDTASAAGLSDQDLDAASYVAYTLARIEAGHGG